MTILEQAIQDARENIADKVAWALLSEEAQGDQKMLEAMARIQHAPDRCARAAMMLQLFGKQP